MPDSNPTVNVNCHAVASERPTTLLFVGSITASNTTLELALQTLDRKKEAIIRWLEDLEADTIEFGEPRFADQVNLDPVTAAQRAARRSLPGAEEVATGSKRNVAICYCATWSIQDRFPEEVMILVDQLQFEAQELKDEAAEEGNKEEYAEVGLNNPFQDAHAFRTMVQQSFFETGETQTVSHVTFLSKLKAENHRRAVQDAMDDGQLVATELADAAGKKLGEIKGINFHQAHMLPHATQRRLGQESMFQLLSETPFKVGEEDILSLSPSPVDFKIRFYVTYELLDS